MCVCVCVCVYIISLFSYKQKKIKFWAKQAQESVIFVSAYLHLMTNRHLCLWLSLIKIFEIYRW